MKPEDKVVEKVVAYFSERKFVKLVYNCLAKTSIPRK